MSLLLWKWDRESSKCVMVVDVWEGNWARYRKSSSACTAAMIHGKTCPLGTGRSITRPRRSWLIFLCSLPVTQLRVDMPFTKIEMWWLEGKDQQHVSISTGPKMLMSQTIKCFSTPCSNWYRMCYFLVMCLLYCSCVTVHGSKWTFLI